MPCFLSSLRSLFITGCRSFFNLPLVLLVLPFVFPPSSLFLRFFVAFCLSPLLSFAPLFFISPFLSLLRSSLPVCIPSSLAVIIHVFLSWLLYLFMYFVSSLFISPVVPCFPPSFISFFASLFMSSRLFSMSACRWLSLPPFLPSLRCFVIASFLASSPPVVQFVVSPCCLLLTCLRPFAMYSFVCYSRLGVLSSFPRHVLCSPVCLHPFSLLLYCPRDSWFPFVLYDAFLYFLRCISLVCFLSFFMSSVARFALLPVRAVVRYSSLDFVRMFVRCFVRAFFKVVLFLLSLVISWFR